MRTNVIPEHLVKAEAAKCLGCYEPPCQKACPAGIDIPGFINRVLTGSLNSAAELIWDKNTLPAICGLVCPQEMLCRGACVAQQLDRVIDIGFLQYYAIKNGLRNGRLTGEIAVDESGTKVAVIGAGPCGLTCAYLLAEAGCMVIVFEQDEQAGGTMAKYIPEHRLPETVKSSDLERLQHKNISFSYRKQFGNDINLRDLTATGYKALFIATGQTVENKASIPGDELDGVYSYKEVFKLFESNKAIFSGKKAVVIGGGNVALDTAVVLKSSGATEVNILYRRSEKEMPAWDEEIEYARNQGVSFRFQVRPVSFRSGHLNKVSNIELILTTADKPETDGRILYKDVPGTEFLMPVDLVVIAIGSTPEREMSSHLPGVQCSLDSMIAVDNATMMTSRTGIFAGGDARLGCSGTVVNAMAEGIAAARGIIKFLNSGGELLE
jgi:glutamate synthase (NADPH/NADH) small chain